MSTPVTVRAKRPTTKAAWSTRVATIPDLELQDLVLALVLADYMWDARLLALPSNETIAARCKLRDTRSVRERIARFERAGLLEVERTAGGPRTNTNRHRGAWPADESRLAELTKPLRSPGPRAHSTPGPHGVRGSDTQPSCDAGSPSVTMGTTGSGTPPPDPMASTRTTKKYRDPIACSTATATIVVARLEAAARASSATTPAAEAPVVAAPSAPRPLCGPSGAAEPAPLRSTPKDDPPAPRARLELAEVLARRSVVRALAPIPPYRKAAARNALAAAIGAETWTVDVGAGRQLADGLEIQGDRDLTERVRAVCSAAPALRGSS